MTTPLRILAVASVLSMLTANAWPDPAARPRAAPLPQTASDALAIVVHRSNPLGELSSADLRRIFMLDRQTWPHGRKITVVLREKGQPERAESIGAICRLTESEYDRHVLLQTFRGNVGWGPRSILSSSAMLRFVSVVPGAIGVVRADEPDGSIKVLRIDGLLPADARYPLRRAPAPQAGRGVFP